ncbi:aldehyde dehydrogenase family protein [Sulfitobacter sp. THAF37]|uniref:aldehyde dehydrogenase family protein n=1 Tax=Sulfitobacter sp. THAF37 TaxID=2587855 RepID=UPI001C12C733
MPDGQGTYYPATVLVDVAPGQPACEDALFGPVASVIRAKDDGDATRIANDSRYGLGGGIFSTDVKRASERRHRPAIRASASARPLDLQSWPGPSEPASLTFIRFMSWPNTSAPTVQTPRMRTSKIL